MATVTHDELEICTDCAILATNDEGTDELRAAVAAQWPTGTIVVVLEEDEDTFFSWRPCDGCGSQLGGDRMPAAVLDGPA